MFNYGNLTLPELMELLKKKQGSLLINPTPEMADNTGIPTGATPSPAPMSVLSRVPVSSRAAEEMTPDVVKQIQEVSPDEKSGNTLQMLGAIAMLLNPLAGALTMREGRRREKRALESKTAAVKSAEESEALRKLRGFEERRVRVGERGVGVQEREADTGERRQETYSRQVQNEEMVRLANQEHQDQMVKVAWANVKNDAERNWIELQKVLLSGKELSKQKLDQMKALHDTIKDGVQLKAAHAVETGMFGKEGRIPTLLADSWWADEADDVAKAYGAPKVILKSKVRSRDLLKIADRAVANKQPIDKALGVVSTMLRDKAITPSEAVAMADYLKFRLVPVTERQIDIFSGK